MTFRTQQPRKGAIPSWGTDSWICAQGSGVVKDWQHDSLAPHWKGQYTVVLTSPTAVKVAGVTPWILCMRVKRAYHADWRTLRALHKRPHWSLWNQDHPKEEKEMKLYNQLLLQGLAGVILRLTIVSVQRGTCAIIKVECCVYIPVLSGNISATLDDMKDQVKAMSYDNIPF